MSTRWLARRCQAALRKSTPAAPELLTGWRISQSNGTSIDSPNSHQHSQEIPALNVLSGLPGLKVAPVRQSTIEDICGC